MRGKNKKLPMESTSHHPRIGIDLMGSDISPFLLMEAILDFSKKLEGQVSLYIFATEDVLVDLPPHPFLEPVPVTEVITMEDDPLISIRRKKNASICTGIRLLQKREIDAFISAGNTGAIIASAQMQLPKLPGIVRPGLLTLLPTKHKEIAVLDIGANVSCKVEHLLQFASMGIAYQKTRGIALPTVGLLNIGSEAKKGTPELREAYQKLLLLNRKCTDNALIFKGNIEGRDVFKGDIDVLITDGFTGNVFLKTAEGIGSFILELLQENALEEFSPHLKEILSSLKQRLHYAEYPGAILCGVEGIVVKCHGDSGLHSISNSIKSTIGLIEHSFLEKIKVQLNQDLQSFKSFF